MSDDLTENLFDEAQDNTDSLYWKAANEVTQLRAKVAELESERDAWANTGRWADKQRLAAEAKVAELEASALTGYEDGWHKLRSERDELKAKLADIAGLVEKWRGELALYAAPERPPDAHDCADELQAILNKEQGGNE
jgi:uncharacterized protein YhaN